MKKLFILLSIFAVLATSALFSTEVYAQTEDLCGGTGGNGEIVSVGDNSFTLKLNEAGEKEEGTLLVTLTARATIETTTGNVSASDLKIGDRVTLIGDNNRDGTFSADAVVVCTKVESIGTVVTGTNTQTPIAVRNKNPEAYEKVSGMVNGVTMLFVGLIWLGVVMFLQLKKKKSLVYLLFFTIFYIYLYKVLDYTLLQFQSLLLLQHFVPDLILRGYEDGTNMNIIPLATLTLEDLKTSLLNILMMMPFGFGLPFITSFRFKQVVVVGLLFSVVIELLQMVTGFMADTTFRVADINDLIFNTIGVTVGYILFAQFVLVFRRVSRNWKMRENPIFHYIAERPQIDIKEDPS